MMNERLFNRTTREASRLSLPSAWFDISTLRLAQRNASSMHRRLTTSAQGIAMTNSRAATAAGTLEGRKVGKSKVGMKNEKE
jgi:hypothetical protein